MDRIAKVLPPSRDRSRGSVRRRATVQRQSAAEMFDTGYQQAQQRSERRNEGNEKKVVVEDLPGEGVKERGGERRNRSERRSELNPSRPDTGDRSTTQSKSQSEQQASSPKISDQLADGVSQERQEGPARRREGRAGGVKARCD